MGLFGFLKKRKKEDTLAKVPAPKGHSDEFMGMGAPEIPSPPAIDRELELPDFPEVPEPAFPEVPVPPISQRSEPIKRRPLPSLEKSEQYPVFERHAPEIEEPDFDIPIHEEEIKYEEPMPRLDFPFEKREMPKLKKREFKPEPTEKPKVMVQPPKPVHHIETKEIHPIMEKNFMKLERFKQVISNLNGARNDIKDIDDSFVRFHEIRADQEKLFAKSKSTLTGLYRTFMAIDKKLFER